MSSPADRLKPLVSVLQSGVSQAQTFIQGKPNQELPSFDELPKFKNFSGCAWSVWGQDDQLGTVNLLTDDVVRAAAKEEIRTGQSVSLNWPVNFPHKPLFQRKSPEITVIAKHGADLPLRDDVIHINTQSGSQWDSLRHFGIIEHGVYYNNTPASAITSGPVTIADPKNISPELQRIGVQNWSNHGICGRGVLLDLVRYFTNKTGSLPYDPWTSHAITLDDILACAKAQTVLFRTGDILLLRVGFIRRYYDSSTEEKDALVGKSETFAGIEQSEDMKRFLWNNHFAAIASDQPALERWPTPEGTPHLHQTILGLWGMPIGEMFDLEKLSSICDKTKRYTFFFSSWPLNVIGGVASPPNAAAYF